MLLIFEHTEKNMSFTNKPLVSLTLDQVLEIVDQLSPVDKLKVARRMQAKERNEAIDDLPSSAA